MESKTYRHRGMYGSFSAKAILFLGLVFLCLAVCFLFGGSTDMPMVCGVLGTVMVGVPWLFSLSRSSYGVGEDSLIVNKRRQIPFRDVTDIVTYTTGDDHLIVTEIGLLTLSDTPLVIKSNVDDFSELIAEICRRSPQAYIDPFTRIVVELAYNESSLFATSMSEEERVAYRILGRMEYRKGARKLQKAILGRHDPRAERMVGLACLMAGDAKEAVEALNAAVGIQSDVQWRFELGLAYFCVGDFESARREFTLSEKSDTAAQTLLGCACLHCGDRRAADEQFSLAEQKFHDPNLSDRLRIPTCELCANDVQVYAGVDYGSADRKRKLIWYTKSGLAVAGGLAASWFVNQQCRAHGHSGGAWFCSLVVFNAIANIPGKKHEAFGAGKYKDCWMDSIWSKTKRDELRIGTGIKSGWM